MPSPSPPMQRGACPYSAGGAGKISLRPLAKRAEVWYNGGMLKHLIDCAMKREACDLVLKNVRIFNVFTGKIEEGDIAVAEGRIVGIGEGFRGKREYDGKGRIALPSFFDAHIHIESSMLSPEAWAELAVPHGTGAIVADPHEIVNVCGIAGAEYIHEAFSRLSHMGERPLDVFLELPSCVPATPFETSGASIGGRETEEEIARGLFFGLGEMMNFPAVLSADEDVLRKIEGAMSQGKPVDGHAPGLAGDALGAYLVAGIRTDHESLTPEECGEKIARGMFVQVRCGSSANNLDDAAKAVNAFNFRRFVLCSDDKNAKDLCGRGHIDDALKRLVKAGVPAEYAVCMATSNVATCYGLKDYGAIAPRYFADIVLVDDMQSFRVRAVFKRGILMAEEGKALFSSKERYLPSSVRSTVKIKKVTASDLKIIGHGGKFRAMEVQPHGLYTGEVFVPAPKGELDVKGTDLTKLAVVERHFATGNVGLGLVKGYGLRGGAIGISVAHDSHNLVVLGDDDEAMARVVSLLEKAGGGMAVVDGEGEDVFALDIAGLMSSGGAEEVVSRTDALQTRARNMGVKEGYEPFMTLVFLSLAVIPELKLTDRGLFSLSKYSFVPLEVMENS